MHVKHWTSFKQFKQPKEQFLQFVPKTNVPMGQEEKHAFWCNKNPETQAMHKLAPSGQERQEEMQDRHSFLKVVVLVEVFIKVVFEMYIEVGQEE